MHSTWGCRGICSCRRIPSAGRRLSHTSDTNWAPRSELMTSGDPWRHMISLNTTLDVSAAVCHFIGNASTHLLKASIITRQQVCPCGPGGSPSMKSNWIQAHGPPGSHWWAKGNCSSDPHPGPSIVHSTYQAVFNPACYLLSPSQPAGYFSDLLVGGLHSFMPWSMGPTDDILSIPPSRCHVRQLQGIFSCL